MKGFCPRLEMRIFLDASVFFAAAGSPTGGSAFVLELAKQKRIEAITIVYALVEAERNIKKKLGSKALDHHRENVLEIDPKIQNIENVSIGIATAFEQLLPRKDVPILLGAILSKTEFLITLDKRDFLQNKKLIEAGFSFTIAAPGEFLRQYIRDK